jgi:hypothetical protein
VPISGCEPALRHALSKENETIRTTAIAAVGGIRWAKRNSTGAQLLASAMLLILGVSAPIVKPPQQGIEEAREDKDRKGGESGDPPDFG